YYLEGPFAMELLKGIVQKLEVGDRSVFLLRLLGDFPAHAVSTLKILEGLFPVLSESEKMSTLESLFGRLERQQSYQNLPSFVERISSHLSESMKQTIAVHFLPRLVLFKEYRSHTVEPVTGVWKELVKCMDVETILGMGPLLMKELPALLPELQGDLAGV